MPDRYRRSPNVVSVGDYWTKDGGRREVVGITARSVLVSTTSASGAVHIWPWDYSDAHRALDQPDAIEQVLDIVFDAELLEDDAQ